MQVFHSNMRGRRVRIFGHIVECLLNNSEDIDPHCLGDDAIDILEIRGDLNARRSSNSTGDGFDRLTQSKPVKLKRTEIVGDISGLLNSERGLRLYFFNDREWVIVRI